MSVFQEKVVFPKNGDWGDKDSEMASNLLMEKQLAIFSCTYLIFTSANMLLIYFSLFLETL